MLDFIGWVATILIIISFIFRDIYKLRLFSMIGAFLWIVYGIMANAYPIIILNVVVAIIQVYWLNRIKRDKKLDCSK
jgi:uncharacterized protein with PQ loop repeat